MGPRAWKAVTRADALSPAVGRRMVGAFLRFMSPFNAPLRARVEAWEPSLCRVRVPPRRALTNHLGGVHDHDVVVGHEVQRARGVRPRQRGTRG